MINYLLIFSICFLKITSFSTFKVKFNLNFLKNMDFSNDNVLAFALCPDII